MSKSKARFLAELLGDNGVVKEDKSALDISDGKISLEELPTITDVKISSANNWNTAYGWGDHSTQNYAVTTGDTFTGNVAVNGGYLESYGKFYLRDDLNFINSDGDGWHTIVEKNGGNPYFNTIDSYRVNNTTVIDSNKNGLFQGLTAGGGSNIVRLFTNSSDKRVLKLRDRSDNTGNIIQFEEYNGSHIWEVVGRKEGAYPFYIYKNWGNGSGYRLTFNQNGHAKFWGNLETGGNLQVGGTTVIDSNRAASFTSVGITNVVTDRIVKFNGAILDDSIMSDDGSTVTVDGTITAEGLDADYLKLQHPGNSYYQRVYTDIDNNLNFGVGANGTRRFSMDAFGSFNLYAGNAKSSIVTSSDGSLTFIANQNAVNSNTFLEFQAPITGGSGTLEPKVRIDHSKTTFYKDVDVSGTIKSEQALIEQVSETKSGTTNHVFVYDTRKDSDGGAWRKRTQHTTWYNEELNTSVRGSRREFPAVAVIVCDNDTDITIYDAEDPEMPMWMVLRIDRDAPKSFPNGNTGSSLVGTVALNGKLVIATGIGWSNVGGGLNIADFVKDEGLTYFRYSSYNNVTKFNAPLGDRFALVESTPIYSNDNSRNINSNTIQDVAITVLKNAPIDPETKLPIPTIAIGTSEGVNIIRPDEKVVRLYNSNASYNKAHLVNFTKDGRVIHSLESTSHRFFRIHNIPEKDYEIGQWSPDADDGITFYTTTDLGEFAYIEGAAPVRRAIEGAIGTDRGLTLYDEKLEKISESLFSYISTDYATGWMVGDQVLSILSSTDSTDFVGGNPIVVDFTDSATWYVAAPNLISSYDTNSFTASGGGCGMGVLAFPNSNLDTEYRITIDYNSTANLELRNTQGSGSAYLIGTPGIGTGIVTYKITPSLANNSQYLYLRASTGGTVTINSLVVTEVEQDRTVNRKDLHNMGTLQKNPVATGADLAAYSGWSRDNYLTGLINPAIGTGDFSVIAWVKPTNLNGGYFHILSVHSKDASGQYSNNGFTFKMTTNTSANLTKCIPYFYSDSGGNNNTYSTSKALVPLNGWSQLICFRRNGVIYVALNGRIRIVGSKNTFSISDSYVSIGSPVHGLETEHGGNVSLALVRLSKTAPTDEQIAKMYNDEKGLFLENAQATIFDTNGNTRVNGLDRDNTTNLLHVGTFDGRSDFSGLVRVNNTTDSVQGTISASNGIIAER